MSRKMHLVGNEMELCGYETSDGEKCDLCEKEQKEHDDKIRKETKAKVLKMLDEEIKIHIQDYPKVESHNLCSVCRTLKEIKIRIEKELK